MNNYVKSFFITISVYAIAFILLFFSFDEDVFCKEKTQTIQNRVAITMIEQQQAALPKKIKKCEKPTPPKEHKPIQKHKKIVKKLPKPKPKTIKKVLHNPAPKERIVKEEAQVMKKEEPKTEIAQIKNSSIPAPVVQNELDKKKAQQEQLQSQIQEQKKRLQEIRQAQLFQQKRQKELQARQDRFMAYLIQRINSNKSYPNMARRRAIEGDVKVVFHVFADGSVQHIQMLSGRSIFERSAIEAISKSFPIEIDKTLFDFPKEFTVTLAYNLTN